MNTELQIFNFNNTPLRILTDEAGDPWFVLKDCMNILSLRNPTETVKMFDDDEFSTTEVIDSIGRRQQAYIISESGFYRLVMKSRKPEAKESQRWVTHEVLPTIRKTLHGRPPRNGHVHKTRHQSRRHEIRVPPDRTNHPQGLGSPPPASRRDHPEQNP